MRRTPLHALFSRLGAKFVPFAGYEMPVQFAGIKQEHLHTRSAAGLFDISHMGQVHLTGPDTAAGLEALVPGDLCSLSPYAQRYTLLTSDAGGILDDIMVTRLPDGLWLVVNAATKLGDVAYLADRLGDSAQVVHLADRALLALQGPAAGSVMAGLCAQAAALSFMHACQCVIRGIPVLVHRCGYTGEDGFEISVAADQSEALATLLLEDSRVAPVGLGARDTLRLEAGLCLYGHDIDENTTPVEAGLAWTVARKYRDGAAPARFPGADEILRQLRDGAGRNRVGLRPQGRAPVREGAKLYNDSGNCIGRVTSGGYGPTLDAPVAMGYVESALAETGTQLHVTVREREQAVRVAPLPFVTHRYFKSGPRPGKD